MICIKQFGRWSAVKKYLGSWINLFVATVCPFFVIGPMIFSIIVLTSQINAATILLAVSCFACSVLWFFYFKKFNLLLQCYSWGTFNSDNFTVKRLGTKSFTLDYSQCKCIGIAFYTHGILNSALGSTIPYIFFSYENFDDKYRSSINLWQPSKTRIKVGFSHELYDYLISVLPPRHAGALRRDYSRYILTKKRKWGK